MFWGGKEIPTLSDVELKAANANLDGRLANLQTVRASAAYIAKMQNQPPAHINPSFLELHKEITTEMTKRGLK